LIVGDAVIALPTGGARVDAERYCIIARCAG
jgi:hypothetical protein